MKAKGLTQSQSNQIIMVLAIAAIFSILGAFFFYWFNKDFLLWFEMGLALLIIASTRADNYRLKNIIQKVKTDD